MSYYDNNSNANNGPQWNNPRPVWENRPIPQQGKTEEPMAFGSQIDEVDRAVDNLVKSGKLYPQQRRDSMPVMGPRGFPQDHGRNRTPSVHNLAMDTHAHPEPRLSQGIPPRHFSTQDFEQIRPHSATALQNFYANQRFQTRPAENEQVLQAKRRLAAQRERDLRNYHQEQQINRTILADMSTFTGKERVVSPGGLNEDDRQTHSRGKSLQNGNNGQGSQGGTRGPSPMSFDPFGLQQQQANQNGNGSIDIHGNLIHDNTSQLGGANTTSNSPERSRTNSVQPLPTRTSASSPSGASPHSQITRTSTTPVTSGGVAPIGTRPMNQMQGQTHNQSLNKRSTTPLPSPLSYGFTNGNSQSNNGADDGYHAQQNERAGSAASNPAANNDANMGWGKNVWNHGGKNLNNVASVWG